MKRTDLREVLDLSGKLDWLVRFEKFVEEKAGKENFPARFYDSGMLENYFIGIPRDEVKEIIRREKAAVEKRLAELGVEI
jgi:hypothetical protein